MSPSPVTAEHGTICQCLFSNAADFKSSASANSSQVKAPAKSCLFAKIKIVAPASFS